MWFILFSSISLVVIVGCCFWMVFSNKKTEKIERVENLTLDFDLFSCKDNGKSMDESRIYTDNFQYEKIGF